MCGRYSIHQVSTDRLKFQFGIDVGFDDLEPLPRRYNLAPSQRAPVVIDTDAGRRLLLAQWGLIPSWTTDPGKLPHPINAKSETAADKPMFRHAYRKSRVLVPADGFYEWKAVAGGKQPYYIRAASGEPLAFGGLLERWQGPEGEVATFTILTTDANALMRPLHNRMPAIILPVHFDRWLDRRLVDAEEVGKMVVPAPDGLLAAYPVSKRVNAPANEGADLIEPVADSGTRSVSS